MHAGFGPVRNSQSTGSMVSEIGAGGAVHWLTGTSAPCTSIFKPVWIDAGLPEQPGEPSAVYDPAMPWWRHEDLHRETLRDYASRAPLLASEQAALECEFARAVEAARTAEAAERLDLTCGCFARAEAAEQRWLAQMRSMPVQHPQGWLYRRAWQGFDKQSRRG